MVRTERVQETRTGLTEGYLAYKVTFRSASGREHTVDILTPGTPFDEHEDANPLLWRPPRVYVEGNSWDRDIAVGACEQERVLEDQAHRERMIRRYHDERG